MLGWLIRLHLLEDRMIMQLLRTFKFGIVRTNDANFNGVSIVIGILSLELQINLSFVKDKKIIMRDYADA